MHIRMPPIQRPSYSDFLFAANGFALSAFAAGAMLFAGPMFQRLGVARGVSLLGERSCAFLISTECTLGEIT